MTHPRCYISIGLHLLHRHIGLPFSFPLLFPSPKPMYDTDLVRDLDMILSGELRLVRYHLAVISLYNINLRATDTTILSIRGVTIPIYFVSSAMDSIRQRIVLFKSVTILTSDPKSEFLCQSSLIAQNLQAPLNHLVCLGYLPRLHHHVSPICPQTQCSHRVP